jgi:hypothetical protein
MKNNPLVLSEYKECRLYWEWAMLHPLLRDYLIKHVNEGKRSNIGGHLLNLIGMRKGIPDYQLPLANQNWHSLWLEMKRKDEINKKQKKEQIEWHERLRSAGNYATFAYGYEDAAQKTMDYLHNRI